MCNTLNFNAYNLAVITMKKRFPVLVLVLLIIAIIVINLTVDNKDLIDKISIFLSSLISLIVAFLIALRRGKNGLVIGLIIGISISSISLLVHYFIAKDYFDTLYIRLLTFVISGISGGVIGVNKKTD